MEDLKVKASELSDSVSEYAKTYYKLSVLNAADKATGIAASTVSGLVMAFLGVFVLLFLSVGLAFWLGDLLDSRALGFVLVAVLFIIIILIVTAMRKRIVFPMIRNTIIKKIYEQSN